MNSTKSKVATDKIGMGLKHEDKGDIATTYSNDMVCKLRIGNKVECNTFKQFLGDQEFLSKEECEKYDNYLIINILILLGNSFIR